MLLGMQMCDILREATMPIITLMSFQKKDLNNNKNAHIIDWDEQRSMCGSCWNEYEKMSPKF